MDNEVVSAQLTPLPVIGHEEARQTLFQLIHSERLPHAILLHGPKGIGKRLLADTLAWHLIAGQGESGDSILGYNAASPEAAQLAAGANGNYVVLQPTESKMIRVDDVRAALSRISLSAEGWRVVVVDCADDMNENGANALLKTLEEPQPNILMVLVSHNPSRLLPTIISRCRQVRLSPLSLPQMKQVLAADANISDDVLALAAGSPGYAQTLAGPGAKMLDAIRQVMQNISKLSAEEAQQKLSAAGEGQLCFSLLQWWIASCARTAAGLPVQDISDTLATEIHRCASQLSPLAWGRLHQNLAEMAQTQNELNLPIAIVLENAMATLINFMRPEAA